MILCFIIYLDSISWASDQSEVHFPLDMWNFIWFVEVAVTLTVIICDGLEKNIKLRGAAWLKQTNKASDSWDGSELSYRSSVPTGEIHLALLQWEIPSVKMSEISFYPH